MRLVKFILLVFTLFAFWVPVALAKEIESLTMISLADSFRPWTITVKADGQVEWNDSSSGYLLDSLKPPEEIKRKSTRINKSEVGRLFKMVSEAGYRGTLDLMREPKVKLIVKFNDGTKTINSGPSGLPAEDKKDKEAIMAFREIERALVKAADFDYKAEVKKYKESFSKPYIFLFYSVVYDDL